MSDKLFKNRKNKMKYTFSIEWNIHMYNHQITCTHGQDKYVAICESAPSNEKTILFWPDDFGLPFEEKDAMINDLREWSESQGFKIIIYQGKSR